MKDHGTINSYSDGALPNVVHHTQAVPLIRPEHKLEQAIRVAEVYADAGRWRLLCDATMGHMNGTTTADPRAEAFAQALASVPPEQVTKRHIDDAFDTAFAAR